MKLNPFSKKSNGYYDSVKTKFDSLGRQLEPKQRELADVRAEYEKTNEKYKRIIESGGRYSLNATPESSRQHAVVCALADQVRILKGEVDSLVDQQKPLVRHIQAPADFSKAKAELCELTGQSKRLQERWQKNDTSIEKIAKRISSVQQKLTEQTRAAAAQLIDSDDEFVVPPALVKLETELKLAQASMAELQRQRQLISDELDPLPRKISDAQGRFKFARSVMAEVEMYEQLMPAMKSIMRTALTRQVHFGSNDTSKVEVDVMQELMEPIQQELDAEMAALA